MSPSALLRFGLGCRGLAPAVTLLPGRPAGSGALPWHVVLGLGLVAGCGSGKGSLGDEDSENDRDARLITDLYTWECEDSVSGSVYQGVFAETVTLEYAPNALAKLTPPSSGGCSANLDMFPSGAGEGAADIPGLDDQVRWETDLATGELEALGTGFYKDDVFSNVHSCQEVDSLLGSGTTLVEAGDLTGIQTPAPVPVPDVSFDGLTFHEETGGSTIEWGDEITASWEAHEWDSVWVQIRREREGEAWEAITCDASAGNSFTLDSAVWDLLDPELEVERNNLYVAFQRSAAAEGEGGLKATTMIRSVAVAVVQD